MHSRDEIKDFLKGMQRFNGTMLERAREFAEFAHDGQFDKAGQPYVNHPERVADYAKNMYDDENLTAAAYLHDIIEDGNFTGSDLSAYFPKAVWQVVVILTREKSQDRQKYIEKIGKNLLAAKVKVADLTDNMDMKRLSYATDKDYERQGRYIDEYRYLKECLRKFDEVMDEEEQKSDNYCEFHM